MMMSEQSMDRLFRTMMELCVQSAMAGARASSAAFPDGGTPTPSASVPQPNVRTALLIPWFLLAFSSSTHCTYCCVCLR